MTHCSFYSQETSYLACHTASLMRKWVWFEGNVGVVKKSRALCVLLSFGPSNVIHVPTPMVLTHMYMYYHTAGKFGGELNLAVGGLYYYNRQIKICQNFLFAYNIIIRMAIPYRTAKFINLLIFLH